MALADADLRAIVARSSTLLERTTGPFTVAADRRSALAASRIERLRHRAAGGDPARFERYLGWHGWDRATLDRVLGGVAYNGDVLPEWATILQQLGPGPPPSDPAAAAPEPFEEALVPFVDVARARLRARAPSDPSTRHARLAFERALFRQLARMAARTLFAEFGAFRLRTASRSAGRGGALPCTLASVVFGPQRVSYDAFIAHLREGGLSQVLVTYPVLARLLSSRVLGWVETTSEFLHRFVADTPLLEEAFAGGQAIGPIATIATDLSDPHRGGRTVCRLMLACGLQIVYKPRSLALEAAFSSLLRWLNDGRLGLPLKAPRVVDCGTHGWMESVAVAPCEDAAAVERYYRRAGMLLCLAYVLGGSDLHQGNVIASGENPVLVDLEAFMGAPMQPDAFSAIEHDPDGQQVWDSVLRTGLLPVDRLGTRGRPHRNGGLVEIDPDYGRSFPHWRHVNTDVMALEVRPSPPHHANLPHLGGAPAAVEEHVEPVVAGFRDMSEVLQRERAELLRGRGVLHAFQGARTRVVLRDTGSYATLLDQGLHPRLLQDGSDWSIEFELLKASATARESRPRSWNTWLAEQRALARLDVPLFNSTSNRRGLDADGEELVSEYLVEPGLAGTRSRLADLDSERTRVHLQCIRLALRRRAPRPGIGSAPRCEATPEDGTQRWLSAATVVARTLRSAASDSNGRSIRWIGIRGLGESTQRGLQGVGWDLYGGRCGVALLFAALESRGVLTEERSFATRVLAPLVDHLNGGGRPCAGGSREAIGALGPGGIVYGLTTISRLLQSEPLLDAAVRAADAITPDTISRDRQLDIISGAAGAALGLLALFNASSRPWVRDRAVLCGRHLLRHSACGHRRPAWRTVEGRATDGFAHGSAGIAYALARLYRETGIAEFRDAAIGALRPDGDRGDRPGDTASVDTSRADTMRRSWCQGSAGIALSRLEVSALAGCPDLRRGLDALLSDTAPNAAGISRSDQLCCGNVGRIAVLTRAADVLDDESWRDAAHAGADEMVARARQRGSYAVSAIDDVFCPGYYQGLSGIAYELLRIRYRDLPSVVLWE